jgi:hypothetical protein
VNPASNSSLYAAYKSHARMDPVMTLPVENLALSRMPLIVLTHQYPASRLPDYKELRNRFVACGAVSEAQCRVGHR